MSFKTFTSNRYSLRVFPFKIVQCNLILPEGYTFTQRWGTYIRYNINFGIKCAVKLILVTELCKVTSKYYMVFVSHLF